MLLLVSIISIGFSSYLFYLICTRVYNLSRLDNDILSGPKKDFYIKPLKVSAVISFVCMGLGLLSLILPQIKVLSKVIPSISYYVIAIIPILVCANLLYKLFDEMEEFDLTKKDSEILKEFLMKTEKDAREKSK